MNQVFFAPVDPVFIKIERRKARELKTTSWWRQRLGEGCCYYCEQKFPRSELTMDHVIPIARGGRTTKKNVVVSCKACNTEKKYKTLAELRMEKFCLHIG